LCRQIHRQHIAEAYSEGGIRPIGASFLLSGYDTDKKPRLFLTEPSGNMTEWTANSIGGNSKQVLEFLEKKYEKSKAFNQ